MGDPEHSTSLISANYWWSAQWERPADQAHLFLATDRMIFIFFGGRFAFSAVS